MRAADARGGSLVRYGWCFMESVRSPVGPHHSLFRAVAGLGSSVLRRIAGFGRFMRFAGAAVAGLKAVKTWARRDRLGRQLYFVGTASVPVVAITGGFIGMILALEAYRQFEAIGQEARLGGIINLSMVKQIGPVLAAVMLAGRVGCSLTAELGSMRVTEQLDAMRAMASDPIRVLVVPRFVACVVMIPPLTIVSNLCGVVGGWLITTQIFDADPQLYTLYSQQFVTWWDIISGMAKSLAFGALIGVISCYKGFTCQPGAEGVGRATTESFVTSFLAIILSCIVLVKILNDIDLWIFGVQSIFK